MQNCPKCSKEGKFLRTSFDIVGKTFYKINKDTFLCYRHWYQLKKPPYQISGEYDCIIREINKAEYLQYNPLNHNLSENIL
jgi:hypothetical protein